MKRSGWILAGLLTGSLLCGAQYEAEHAVLNPAHSVTEKDAAASGGTCVRLVSKTRINQPDQAPAAVSWRIPV